MCTKQEKIKGRNKNVFIQSDKKQKSAVFPLTMGKNR